MSHWHSGCWYKLHDELENLEVLPVIMPAEPCKTPHHSTASAGQFAKNNLNGPYAPLLSRSLALPATNWLNLPLKTASVRCVCRAPEFECSNLASAGHKCRTKLLRLAGTVGLPQGK